MNKIKVILIKDEPNNKNVASYNRNIAIEKMVKASFEYSVVGPKYTSDSIHNKYIKVIYRKTLFLLSLRDITSHTNNKEYQYVLFLRTIDPLIAFFVWIISRRKGVKLAIERNEFPSVMLSGNIIQKLFYRYFILPWHYRIFDIFFLMTDELINYFSPFTKKNVIVKKLPMTVDFSRFENVNIDNEKSYIFYAGSLSENKDGVESLIYAFHSVTGFLPNLFLKVAGNSKKGNLEQKLKGLVEQLNLRDRVILLGNVDREVIPKYICSSALLVLPRPDSKQARGGFPTKLGEYLASGRPVIVTQVGEIPKYLSENDVYFISSNNIVEELPLKIKYIISHYDEALIKAQNGKEKAKRYFSLEANQLIIKNAFREAFN